MRSEKKRPEAPQPVFDDVLKRMLSTPREPKKRPKPEEAAKNKPAK